MNALTTLDFEKLPELSKEEIRDLIANVEQAMITATGEKLNIEPVHYFSKGVYGREILIPKGSLIVGKIHKFENFNIMSKGDMSIISIEGVKRIKAPYAVVSPSGVKRLAYAHEDTVWTTIHGTDETDVDKIEEIFIAKSYTDLISQEEKLCLG